jgi:hypothetical protein
MGSLQTVLPFKLAATDESLTAHSGLALFGEYMRAMGVGGLIDHELPGPSSAAGYDPSAHVFPLVLMLAGGGRTLEDLRVLRNDAGLRALGSGWERSQVQTARWRLFQTAGKIVRHGRQLFLKISAAMLDV